MTGRSEKPKGASSRPPISEATRLKMREAKIGKKHAPEHRAKIAESMRAAHAQGVHQAHSHLRALSEGEREDYQTLTRVGHFRKAQALMKIGRVDLISRAEVLRIIGRMNLLSEDRS